MAEQNKKPAYTMTDAVRETLAQLPKNQDFKFLDFLNYCRALMKVNGNYKEPFDSTIQRTMRACRAKYNIVCVDRTKSIYRLEK